MKDFKSIISDIDQRKFAPIYFLVGEKETFFVDLIAEKIEATVLTEDEKAFNQSILYGKEVTIDDVIGQAKQYPMMSDYRVIIVREAQSLLKNIDTLSSYVEHPQQNTILVFCVKYKKMDGRQKVTKLLKKSAVYFETKPMYDNQVPQWISETLSTSGYTIAPKASEMLVEFLGNNLSHIYKELEKLQNILSKGSKITPELVEENIGISKDFNNFELTKAIGIKDEMKAQRIVAYFAQNSKNHPIILTMTQLNSFFNKLLRYHALKDKSQYAASAALSINPFFVKDYSFAAQNYTMKKASQAIALIREVDMKSKGVNSNQVPSGDLMKELLVKLMR
ncbi:DNA polymerase III subunit delta [Psychroflexus sp. MES1-P1E]|jgi:DNA polymerase-3 subunit delta|uniref:DNA polymerase III subunit delta n=1 Tax=Psychroflexus sp. MES1-P1E TaxID=2058320 RepID=UPI000C7DBBDE|nr:DNA polymerase III subunit delta [Psychroflexus sp. MES1-P1E]PKG41759.1 DNA polymerase III subunit delta [Psychroflexus sp. MES1-P1E]